MSQAVNEILNQAPSRKMLGVVGIVAAIVAVSTMALFPFSTRALPVIEAYMPMYAMAVVLIEGLTAYFFAIQYRFTGWPFMAALSGAYGYVVVMVVFQVMVFPGIFSETGLLTAGPQGAPWLWVTWHAGFPLFVLIALRFYALRPSPVAQSAVDRSSNFPGAVLMLGPVAFGLFVAWVVVSLGDRLPELVTGKSYSNIADSFLAPLVIALGVAALVVCVIVTRMRDLLGLWLALALLAALGDVVLTLSAIARYSVGWYAARVMSLISSSLVLGFLIWEISGLYRQLLDSHRQLEDRVTYDGLTEAYNRGYFTSHLEKAMVLARQEGVPLSLLMIDADHFKGYNDHQGHQKGDQCLVAIVAAIKKVLRRAGDCVARYGGEEFVVVLPGANAHTAESIAAQIHAQIALLQIPRFDGLSAHVTVSIGIATYDGQGGPMDREDLDREDMDHEELIRRADAALYRAKHAGRNTSVIFDAA